MFLPGDEILSSVPLVHVLSSKERGIRCDECLKSQESLLRCSKCQVARYCNRNCQKLAWSLHKWECRSLLRVAPNVPTDSVRLYYRLLVRLQKLGGESDSEEAFGRQRTFADLMSHAAEIRADESRMADFVTLCHTLKAYAGDTIDLPSSEECLEIFGKMVINSFSICDGEMQSIGVGLYLGASVLDHSCDPTAVVTFNGIEAVVRFVKPTEIGQPVTISYIELLDTARCCGDQLRAQYYFTCQCQKCNHGNTQDSKKLGLKCPTPNCSGMVVTKDNETFTCCGCCRDDWTSAELARMKEALGGLQQSVGRLKDTHRQRDFERLLTECERSLCESAPSVHPHNVYVVQATDMAMDACVQLQKWEKAARYGNQLLEAYRLYYPQFHPSVGVLQMKLGKLLLHLGNLEQALRNLQQAEVILRVTHGSSHKLYHDLQQLLVQCRMELMCQQ